MKNSRSALLATDADRARMSADAIAERLSLLALVGPHACGWGPRPAFADGQLLGYQDGAPMLTFPEPDGFGPLLRDPVHGLHGIEFPDPEKVLKIWATDLLTIEHAGGWRIVFDAADPFPPDWLQQVAGADFVLVLATPDEMPVGVGNTRELLSGPCGFFRVEDRRQAAA